jgi:predicted TIM-barrel fold metal-dependent hydrolase
MKQQGGIGMVYDGHIHIGRGDPDRAGMKAKMHKAGVAGGVLLSLPPAAFYPNGLAETKEERLDNLFEWVGGDPDLFPFYWIDPLEEDAIAQVAYACGRGVLGFKIICSRFYPGDMKAMEVYRSIAANGRPILFHSGILWDGQPSSQFNRPVGFEPLVEIKGLRFALAHISWPWCDENIAVYGKVQHSLAHRADLSAEMFIDTTPGTPPIYREEALTKLFTVGYPVAGNVIFGSDSMANDYGSEWTAEWLGRDRKVYDKLGLDKEVVDKIHGRNLLRFIHG